jgi:hypothetical protein
MADEENKLSTSALAKRLDIPSQQLFATLKDYGWIQRHEDTWLLTTKGEFEGGSYQESRRYGRYIVWPESLQTHRLVSAIESSKRITAAGMRRLYPGLELRHINRALAELGLQVHTVLGWEITQLGTRLGGQQQESESSGALYVNWPHEFAENPILQRELHKLLAQPQVQPEVQPPTDAVADDLFAAAAAEAVHESHAVRHDGVDGHCLNTELERQVCNWLYMAQLAHAHCRALPVEDELYADFYLPAAGVYIECWEAEEGKERLGNKLRKKDVFRELQLPVLELNAGDGDKLDDLLGKALVEFGIRV